MKHGEPSNMDGTLCTERLAVRSKLSPTLVEGEIPPTFWLPLKCFKKSMLCSIVLNRRKTTTITCENM